MITIDDLKKIVPKHSKGLLNQGIVDAFNRIESDEGADFLEHYKQNFVSMSSVLKTGQYSTKDYISAVKYVAHKLLENSDIDAYHLTFPDRYNRLLTKWMNEGMTGDEVRTKKISPYVTAYKRNDLVMKLAEQALMPSKILNAPHFQEALNVQIGLMYTARSEMVRMSAANSVLQYTAPNEIAKIELDVAIRGTDEVQALKDEMHRLAGVQQGSIASGFNTALDVAETKIMHEVIVDAEEE